MQDLDETAVGVGELGGIGENGGHGVSFACGGWKGSLKVRFQAGFGVIWKDCRLSCQTQQNRWVLRFCWVATQPTLAVDFTRVVQVVSTQLALVVDVLGHGVSRWAGWIFRRRLRPSERVVGWVANPTKQISFTVLLGLDPTYACFVEAV